MILLDQPLGTPDQDLKRKEILIVVLGWRKWYFLVYCVIPDDTVPVLELKGLFSSDAKYRYDIDIYDTCPIG